MDFFQADRLQVVFDLQRGDVDESGAAEIVRVEQFKILDGEGWMQEADGQPADHHLQAGQPPNLAFRQRFGDRIEKKNQQGEQKDENQKQSEEPLEEFL